MRYLQTSPDHHKELNPEVKHRWRIQIVVVWRPHRQPSMDHMGRPFVAVALLEIHFCLVFVRAVQLVADSLALL